MRLDVSIVVGGLEDGWGMTMTYGRSTSSGSRTVYVRFVMGTSKALILLPVVTYGLIFNIATNHGDTLAERYEKTMARLEQIRQAGRILSKYNGNVTGKGTLADHPELKTPHRTAVR